jgi:hypothetical protein
VIALHGHNWHTHPRTLADTVRCLAGRHKAVLHALDGGVHVSRCSCGALRIRHGRWSRPESPWPRRGVPEPVEYREAY